MPTRDLMTKALELVRKNGAGAALVILPLAQALPANADSVPFTVGDVHINSVSSGLGYGAPSDLGHIHVLPITGGTALTLYGDTYPPSLNKSDPNPPVALPAGLYDQSVGPKVEFYWSGGFGSAPVDPDYSLILGYHFDVLGTLASGDPPNDANLSWTLSASVYDDPDRDQTLANFTASGGGFSSVPDPGLPPIPLVPSIVPGFWEVDLFINWNVYPLGSSTGANGDDTLQFNPTINLLVQSQAGGSSGGPLPVPLPSTLWMSGVLILGVSMLLIRQSVKPLPAA